LDFIGPFLTERWYVVVVALLVLFWVVRKVVQAALKWGLVLAVLAAVVFYGVNYREHVVNFGKNVGSTVAAEIKDDAMRALRSEFKDAHYEGKSDGSFVVSSRSVKLAGKTGTREAKVTFKNHTFDIKMDDALNALVEQVKERR
jgi:hypothetical protein